MAAGSGGVCWALWRRSARGWGWAACRSAMAGAGRVSLLLRSPGQLAACRQKSSFSFLSRPDRPNLAYNKIKGKNPGVVFLPGLNSNMNGQKAVALEDFCKSLGHAFVRFDYTGCGSSDGNLQECTVGKWRKDVLSVLDELTDGPQILVGSSLGGWLMLHAAIARPEKVAALVGVAVAADYLVTTFKRLPLEVQKEIEEKGEWKLPTKHNEEGFYCLSYDVIKEAENHCLLNSPIPITCPIRLIHGMKDEDVPWQVSMQIADQVLSTDVDVILRKVGQHRMKEKDDMKLLVYTVDDLIDKLTTLA
ncbi:palmitoyl-protein thioesterase ABHD10, mitochondrial isoform X1 [Emydura macquarii macquarii]|uniref:palmitoyl-protein thioesterase ABHD10, mitochondrial isoform X1 n=2 Tax=Emydura macquarii macquarii TaxID=1129001 RepID=UPI00352A0BAF